MRTYRIQPSYGVVASFLFTLALACGGDSDAQQTHVDSDLSQVDYEVPPESGTCGGKCDDPYQDHKISENRLIDSLDIIRYEADAESGTESFAFLGEIKDEDYGKVNKGHVLKLEVSIVEDGTPSTVVLEEELTYMRDGDEIDAFTSPLIDTSQIVPWNTIYVSVKGEFEDREILQAFGFVSNHLHLSFELIPEEKLGADNSSSSNYQDPLHSAYNVDQPVISIPLDFIARDAERYARTQEPFGLAGVQIWQRWEGGKSPVYLYDEATNLSKNCINASSRRFDEIMRTPSVVLIELMESTSWGGEFFQVSDDFSSSKATASPEGAALKALSSDMILWISQVDGEGSCHLPTADLVERFAKSCLDTSSEAEGSVESCELT